MSTEIAQTSQAHLSETALAERWTVCRRTLQRWRHLGIGPDFIRLRRRIVYALDDITRFEAANRTTLGDAPSKNGEHK